MKPRSSSLNPLIYPSWWGDDVKEFKHAIMKRDRSHAPTGFQQHTTLENRIRQAREEPAFNVQQAYQRQTAAFNSNRGYTTNETGRTEVSPSYAFTSNKNAPKYSPIRNMRPGANNIPMSYAGPPSQEEINRNRGRLHPANAYSRRQPAEPPQYYKQGPPPQYSVEEESYLEASPDENTDSRNVGNMGGRKGVVLSYSPPGEKNARKPPSSRRPQLTS